MPLKSAIHWPKKKRVRVRMFSRQVVRGLPDVNHLSNSHGHPTGLQCNRSLLSWRSLAKWDQSQNNFHHNNNNNNNNNHQPQTRNCCQRGIRKVALECWVPKNPHDPCELSTHLKDLDSNRPTPRCFRWSTWGAVTAGVTSVGRWVFQNQVEAVDFWC